VSLGAIVFERVGVSPSFLLLLLLLLFLLLVYVPNQAMVISTPLPV